MGEHQRPPAISGGCAFPRAIAWKWTFSQEWVRLGGAAKNPSQRAERALLLYEVHGERDQTR